MRTFLLVGIICLSQTSSAESFWINDKYLCKEAESGMVLAIDSTFKVVSLKGINKKIKKARKKNLKSKLSRLIKKKKLIQTHISSCAAAKKIFCEAQSTYELCIETLYFPYESCHDEKLSGLGSSYRRDVSEGLATSDCASSGNIFESIWSIKILAGTLKSYKLKRPCGLQKCAS